MEKIRNQSVVSDPRIIKYDLTGAFVIVYNLKRVEIRYHQKQRNWNFCDLVKSETCKSDFIKYNVTGSFVVV